MKFFFVFGKSLPLFPEWLRAQSFFQCRAQSFFLCTELFPVPCTGTELSAVHRAFSCAQSFLPCTGTELSAVHRASFWHRKSHLLCKRLVPKLQNSAKPNSGDSLPVFCVHGAFSSAQSFLLCTELFPVPCTGTELFPVRRAFSSTRSFFQCRAQAQSFVLAAFATLVCQRNCGFSLQRHKTPEFGEAEFSDCLPVFALECFSAFDTGGLWLWLGAFGRSRLYRCQSVPGPPMPVFCGTELRFGSLCNLGLSKKLRFFFAKAQNLR